jgi:hypothetical protein
MYFTCDFNNSINSSLDLREYFLGIYCLMMLSSSFEVIYVGVVTCEIIGFNGFQGL